MKRQGIIPLVIPYDTKDLKYYFKRIHGLYLPSGGAFAGTQQKYYNCCKKLMLMAMKENDKGCHFPVWGCCMGCFKVVVWLLLFKCLTASLEISTTICVFVLEYH